MPLFRAKAKLSRQLLSYDYFINMKLQQRKNMCVCVCVCVCVYVLIITIMVYLNKMVDSLFLNRVAPSGWAGCSVNKSA